MKYRELGLRVIGRVDKIVGVLKTAVSIRAPTERLVVKAINKLSSPFKRLSFKWKLVCLLPIAVFVLVLSIVFLGRPDYSLTPSAKLVIGDTNENMLSSLKLNSKSNSFVLNQKGISAAGSTLGSSMAVGGTTSSGAYSAILPKEASKGITIYDDTSDLSFSIVPNISLSSAKDINGHIVYPGSGGLQAVYTLLGDGLKEDLVLNHKSANTETYSFTLKLPGYLEAKENGANSIGIYSADSALFGKISYGNSAAEQSVMKARLNSPKNNLVFELLPPVVNESSGKLNGKPSDVSTKLTLKGDTVIVSAVGLDKLTYPISIDPSVLVTSASLANGNNEGDASSSGGELSEAGLDGGSLSAGWSSTSSLPTGTFNATSVAYDGYLYDIGGNTSSGVISNVYYAAINNNGTLGSWSSTTSLPTATADATSVVYNGYLYEIGGYTTSMTTTVDYAPINSNGTLGSWTATTSLSAGIDFATSVVYNGYLYEMGGDTSSLTANVYYAPINSNGTLGSWTSTASLTSATDGASSVAYNGYVYEIGGNINSGPNASTYYAPINSNGTLGPWAATSSFGSASYGQTTVAYNGYIYMLGGTTGSTSQDYGYTGSSTTFTVPAGVTSVTVDMSGGAGGAGDAGVVTEDIYDPDPDECDCEIYGAYNAGGSGGNGTRVQGVVSVSPEEQLSIYVAGAGGVGPNGSSGGAGGYGYGDGGSGKGSGDGGNDGASGGGGGSSAITSGGSALAVAGGGGGGGGGSYEWLDETFSNGQEDGEAGCTGGSGGANSSGSVAGGCNVSGGGLNWSAYNGSGGSLGGSGSAAGQAGQADSNSEYGEGGGGGGGYAGGSLGYAGIGASDCLVNADDDFNCDGAGGGGGGGSSLVPSSGSATSGYESGNGYVDISYGGDYSSVQYAPIDPAGVVSGWSGTTSLPAAVQAVTSVAYNNYIYEIGYTTAVYYAPINSNGTLGSWTATTSLATNTSEATSVAYNGYLYEIGGGNGEPTATVDYAPINSNGTLGSWTATTSLPAATQQASSIVYNGYVYEIGGYSGGSAVTTVDYAPINSNGTLGSWTTTTSLPATSYDATSVIDDGYVYEIGGVVSGSISTAVDYAPINSNGTLGSWTATTSLPVGAFSATSVVSNGYIYEMGGQTGSLTANVYYAPINSNGTLGSWAETNSLPSAIDWSTSVAYNGYIYEIGGNISSGIVATVDYSQINNGGPGTLSSWSSTTSLGTATENATSVAYNGYLYEIGGSTSGGLTADVYYAPINANGTLGAWSSTTSLGAVNYYATSVAYNGYLYEIGGISASVYYAPINANGTLGSWSSTTSLVSSTYYATSVVYNGYVYEMGGITSDNATASVYYAPINTNGTLGSWTATTSLETATAQATSVVYNGYVYEIAGADTSNGLTAYVYYAPINTNGTLGSWTATTSLGTATYNAASVAYNGYLYEIGGATNSSITGNVYRAPINANGTLGSWGLTSSISTGVYALTSAAYDGYLYEIGGQNTGGYSTTVDYAALQSIPRIGYYSLLVDLSGSSSKDPTPTELITYGTDRGNPGLGGISGLGTGGVQVSYSLASNSCSALTSPATLLSSTELNTAYPINNKVTNGCSNGSNDFRYVWVRYELDDSQTASFPDINGNHTTITGLQVYYEPASSGRLRGGESFTSGSLQSLYAPPTTGAP